MSYDKALNAVLAQFQKRYLPEDDGELTQEELDAIYLSVASNAEVLKELIHKYITPMYKTAVLANNMAKRESQAAKKAEENANIPVGDAVSVEPVKEKRPRRKSTWQIYLTYASELIPGYQESTRKITLCKEHYKLLTTEEMEQLCKRYYTENPNGTPLAVKGTKPPARRGGVTGWSLFSSEWHAKQKALNPAHGFGPRSEECSRAWRELSDEERTVYNDKANVNKGM